MFDVIERPIALRNDNIHYRELEVETKPQQTWTGVFSDNAGLVVVAPGQYETAVRDREERPIALTLYRSFRRTVFTDGEPDAQLFNHDLTFPYWIVPIKGKPDLAHLTQMGIAVAAGTRAVQTRPVDQRRFADGTTKLPVTGGLYELTGNVVATSTRLIGDALEIRLFNPSVDPTKATIVLTDPTWITNAVRYEFVDFESNVLGKAQNVKKGQISLNLAGKKIVTIRIAR